MTLGPCLSRLRHVSLTAEGWLAIVVWGLDGFSHGMSLVQGTNGHGVREADEPCASDCNSAFFCELFDRPERREPTSGAVG